MARPLHRLSARSVATVTIPGLHADGGGLYLRVDAAGAKRWCYLFQWERKRQEMGLGSLRDVSLAQAREKARAAREMVLAGRNPIVERRRPLASPVASFGTVADQVLAGLNLSKGQMAGWTLALETYAAPMRDLPVDQVTTNDVLAVLQPHWTQIPETASRLRGRIERVLDAAKVQGLRTGENPARWKGHLSHLLAARQAHQKGHHEAMPFDEAPAFMARLRGAEGFGARALEFTILTAVRTGETTGACYRELDLTRAVWTIPKERMKAKREHRVPLSRDALAIIAAVRLPGTPGPDDYVFPGLKPGRPISNMTMDGVLRRMGLDVTVHGFRSTFRDWAGETTTFPRETIEAALAHQVGNAVEQAYRRGDALEKRRPLMEAWAAYLHG